LGRPLHYEPTAGGSGEGIKFHDWYSETLKSYVRLFGEEPRQDVWPEPEKRFSRADPWKWINVGDYWLVPRLYVWSIVATAMLLAFSILPGCASTFFSAEQAGWLSPMIVGGIFPFNLRAKGGSQNDPIPKNFHRSREWRYRFNEVVAELLQEHVQLKKALGEPGMDAAKCSVNLAHDSRDQVVGYVNY